MRFYENNFKIRSEKSVDELVRYLLMNCAVKNTYPFEEPLNISSYQHYCKIEWNKINFGWTTYQGVEIEGIISTAHTNSIIDCKIVGFKFHLFFYMAFTIIGMILLVKDYLTYKIISEAIVFYAFMVILGIFKLNVIRKDLIFRKMEFIGFIEKMN